MNKWIKTKLFWSVYSILNIDYIIELYYTPILRIWVILIVSDNETVTKRFYIIIWDWVSNNNRFYMSSIIAMSSFDLYIYYWIST